MIYWLLVALGCVALISCTAVINSDSDNYLAERHIVESCVESCVVNYIIEGDEIKLPLTNVEISVEEGAKVFANRESGHCVLCHRIASIDAPFQGNLGPDLSNVGVRLTSAQLRFRIVDASRLNPHTIMPPYYRITDLQQVAATVVNQTVLNEIQIEQLVKFLASSSGSPK